jgi:hypothetical protein
MTHESASGPAAVIAALKGVPESTQHLVLKNQDSQDQREVDLEKHRLEIMAKDRSEARALAAKGKGRTELLRFWYVAVVTAAMLALVTYLFATGQAQIATPTAGAETEQGPRTSSGAASCGGLEHDRQTHPTRPVTASRRLAERLCLCFWHGYGYPVAYGARTGRAPAEHQEHGEISVA